MSLAEELINQVIEAKGDVAGIAKALSDKFGVKARVGGKVGDFHSIPMPTNVDKKKAKQVVYMHMTGKKLPPAQFNSPAGRNLAAQGKSKIKRIEWDDTDMLIKFV